MNTIHAPVSHLLPVMLLAIVLAACMSACSREREGPGGESGRANLPPLAQPRLPAAIVPAFHEGTQARHERFNAISKEGSAKLVFLGDSITEGWEGAGAAAWEKYYGPATGRHAANFGIGGDRTEHVLWRLEHGNFDGLNPKLIVVMIGTNNAGHRKDPSEETARGVTAILNRLRAKCPTSKILVLGIFPRGDKLDDADRVLNEEVNVRVRDEIRGVSARVRYRDVGEIFLDANGLPRRDLMPDLLHLNPEAYELWAKAIEKDVQWGME